MNLHKTPPRPNRDNGYLRRFERVIEYIYDHLDEDIDLNTLAEVAALSPWHWHRVWQSLYGESIFSMVKRLRLHRAASDLAYTARPVSEIARRAGYSSSEAFGRSFKTAYRQSPSQYRVSRMRPNDDLNALITWKGHTDMYEVSIRDLPAERIASLPHKGSYMEIGRAFETLVGILVSRGLVAQILGMKAYYFSDPTHVAEEDLRSCAGAVVAEGFPIEAPLEAYESRGGRYAVLTHVGPYAELKAAYDWLYGHWLPQSGQTPADAPCIENYLNNPRDTAPSDLLTEVCLPLANEG
ncbi:AraC family transcriptional regulator [Roseibium denhamense]|uniref:Transcriptional regulator, AraC family n=1 Tax=Roseibium denhamense TaxID=76305 RepID=A0ABY1NG50_9HYPH|nr:AraC family transcriptional regulator [Roseibium denhamense]SMP08235.1 transcriptional regulator, AraC family [Roseibium denhamense]